MAASNEQQVIPTHVQSALTHGVGSFFTTPFTTIRILHQIGYDIPAVQQPSYEVGSLARVGWRPATFRDAKQIINKHGWKALYTGAPTWTAASIVTMITRSQVSELCRSLEILRPITRGSDEAMLSYELRHFGREVFVETLTTCTASFCAYPLRVAGTYQTAQLVGGENGFGMSPWGCIRTIVRAEGSDALIKGLALELLGDITEVFCKAVFRRIVEYYFAPLFSENEAMEDEERTQLEATKLFTITHLTNELALPFCYPLRLANTLAIVNGAPMVAGQQPFAPPGLTSVTSTLGHLWTMPNHRGIFRAVPSIAAKLYC